MFLYKSLLSVLLGFFLFFYYHWSQSFHRNLLRLMFVMQEIQTSNCNILHSSAPGHSSKCSSATWNWLLQQEFSSGLDEDVLGDRFRSFAYSCLALAKCQCGTNQTMCIFPGFLMLQRNLLGMVKSAQESCEILGDIGQICPWKPSVSVPGRTALESLASFSLEIQLLQ